MSLDVLEQPDRPVERLANPGGAEVLGQPVDAERLAVGLLPGVGRPAEVVDFPVEAAELLVPEIAEQVLELAIRQLAILRIGVAAEGRGECPEDAGVEDAALAGGRVRLAVHRDRANESALFEIHRVRGPVGQDVAAEFHLRGRSEVAESLGRVHGRMVVTFAGRRGRGGFGGAGPGPPRRGSGFRARPGASRATGGFLRFTHGGGATEIRDMPRPATKRRGRLRGGLLADYGYQPLHDGVSMPR